MSRVVNTVFKQKSKLIELFSDLCDNPQNWDGDTILAIEKQLLVELKRSPTFYSDVIKSFLKKDRRFQLEYK